MTRSGVLLGENIEIAAGSAARRQGLLGRDSLPENSGLWIVPCTAIHTFFMRFAIDVVFLNSKHQVVKIRQNLTKNRLAGSFRAHSVLELPAGTVARTGTTTGDQLAFDG